MTLYFGRTVNHCISADDSKPLCDDFSLLQNIFLDLLCCKGSLTQKGNSIYRKPIQIGFLKMQPK